MGLTQLTRRWQSGRQLIQSQGITYNVANRPEGIEHSWPMDPIPLVIDTREWASIEQAVGQRAKLLNAILADLYGPQKLLHERKLPRHWSMRIRIFLPLRNYSFGRHAPAQLCRGYRALSDGSWWVVADRTQAPSGMGYTLQNVWSVHAHCREHSTSVMYGSWRGSSISSVKRC